MTSLGAATATAAPAPPPEDRVARLERRMVRLELWLAVLVVTGLVELPAKLKPLLSLLGGSP